MHSLPTQVLRLPDIGRRDDEDDDCAAALACARTVHAALGPGLAPLFYCRALALELAGRGVPYQRDCWFDLRFRGSSLGRVHFDLLLDQLAICVLSQPHIPRLELLRLQASLRAAERPQGLALNFGGDELQARRLPADLDG